MRSDAFDNLSHKLLDNILLIIFLILIVPILILILISMIRLASSISRNVIPSGCLNLNFAKVMLLHLILVVLLAAVTLIIVGTTVAVMEIFGDFQKYVGEFLS